ncbi:hypothetical protein SAMN02910358_00296 [Lachnospiraceae bacterium XBB1006]|nr:hypothetical protein SAMN02910358_00296 [Lachnospiraceae bacterium XBB1006]
MLEVQAVIVNFSFPKSLEELLAIERENGGLDIENLLENADLYSWTMPKWIKPDDIAFLMHARSSITTIRHLKKQLKMDRTVFSNEEYKILTEALEVGEEIYRKFGGKIFMVARVGGKPYYGEPEELGYSPHWKSRIYADIKEGHVLKTPIDLSEFNSFIKLSCGGTFTPVYGKQYEQLKSLIKTKNEIPDYMDKSVAMPIPFARMNDKNWMQASVKYRRSFMYESQFRAFYVDYFLRGLADRKTIYRECACKKDKSRPAFVDNVIIFGGKYLLVEVKLSKDAEQNLFGQLKKYCDVKELKLDSKRDVDKSLIVADYVLLIDTYGVYLYSYKNESLIRIADLDDIRDSDDILKIRNAILDLLCKK